MVKKSAVILALAVALACAGATPYQRKGANGGYTDVPLDGRTYVVSFEGNEQTDKDRVVAYLQYRCAELTSEAGYTHYIVLHGRAGSDTSSVVTNFAGGPHMPTAISEARSKPYTSVIIKVFKGDAPPGAFDAAEVLRTLGPKIGQPDRWQPRAS